MLLVVEVPRPRTDFAPSAGPRTLTARVTVPDDSRFRPFQHAVAPNAPLYRAIMRTFAGAKQRFVVHLRAEDVAEGLEDDGSVPSLDGDTLANALQQLVEWENLRADRDNARVSTPEDFNRARYIFQLTPAGEAAELALQTFDERLGNRGALQAVALADIEARLRDLLRHCDEPDPDVPAVAVAMRDLFQRSTDLAENAQAFMGSLQSTIELHDVDVDAFVAYRERLVDYLERFLGELVSIGSVIAQLVPLLDAAGIDRLLVLVAARDASDATPVDGATQTAEDVAIAHARSRWSGLRRWFVDDADHPSQAQLLRRRARSSIPQLLMAVARLNERREGRADRAADFTTLARWFAEAPSDRDRHRLWRVAFGLHPARHLAVDAETVTERRDHPVPATTAWSDAPAVHISPQLRRTGSYERRGRPNRVRDRSADRERLRARAGAEAAQTEAARRRLLTDGAVRLSSLDPIAAEAFPMFLALLGDALSVRRPGRDEVDVTTGDGALRVRLRPTGDGRSATIRTTHGTLRGPDHHLTIERADA